MSGDYEPEVTVSMVSNSTHSHDLLHTHLQIIVRRVNKINVSLNAHNVSLNASHIK